MTLSYRTAPPPPPVLVVKHNNSLWRRYEYQIYVCNAVNQRLQTVITATHEACDKQLMTASHKEYH